MSPNPGPPPARRPFPDDGDAEPDSEDDEQPWLVTREPPVPLPAWVDELLQAYGQVGAEPQLRTSAGRRVVLPERGLLEDAVLLCLQARGVSAPLEAIEDLVAVVSTLSADLRAMGPEWHTLQQVPPLAFTVYYVWAHIVIGHLDEDQAMEVVRAATERLEAFEAVAARLRPGAPDAAGEEGEQGEKGEQGEQGEKGAAGRDAAGPAPAPAPRGRPPRRGRDRRRRRRSDGG